MNNGLGSALSGKANQGCGEAKSHIILFDGRTTLLRLSVVKELPSQKPNKIRCISGRKRSKYTNIFVLILTMTAVEYFSDTQQSNVVGCIDCR